MHRITIYLVLLSLFGAAERAKAQHLDVWVHLDAVNRVESGYFDVNAGNPIVPNDRAVGYNFGDFSDEPNYANNPGFFAEQNFNTDGTPNPGGSQLPAGTLVQFNILSSLLYWNGVDPVSFGPVPAGESLTMYVGNSEATVGPNTGPQPGFTIQQIRSNTQLAPYAAGSMHQHMDSYINAGIGNASATSGIYIFEMQLTTNDPNASNSLPFWIVWNNNIGEDQRGEAINYLYPNQWSGPLGGSYSNVSNWSGTIQVGNIVPIPQVPNGVDAVARFYDNLYSSDTITIDSPVTLGTVSFASVPSYTLAGPATLTLQSSTTAQINLTTGNHTISAPLNLVSSAIVAAGQNTLTFAGAQTWGSGTTLTVQSGTLTYGITSGPTVVNPGARLLISQGATVNVTGSVNPLFDGANKVAIENDSVGGLVIDQAGVIAGPLTGLGTTTVDADATLTVDSIDQSGLMLEGAPGHLAVLTLAPSIVGGSSAAESSFAASPFAAASTESRLFELLAKRGRADGAGNGGASVFTPTTSVPEPTSLSLLVAAGALAPLWLLRKAVRVQSVTHNHV